MASIGAVACTFVRGEAPAPKPRLSLWQVPGVDGYGAQRMGLGDSEFQFTAVYYGSRAQVEAWALAVQALQGVLTTIVNDWGTAYTRCLPVKIGVPKVTPALHAGGARGEITLAGVVV